MTYEEVRNQLQALTAGKKAVVEYSQTDRINQNSALRGRVSDGFCVGAAMHWLHLVLQGSDSRTVPDDIGSAVAFFAGSNTRQQPWYEERKRLLKKADADDDEATKQIFDKLNALIEAKHKAGTLTDADMTKYEQAVEEIKRRRKEKKTKIEGLLTTESLYSQFWMDFAKVMDDKLKSTKYKNLTIAHSSSNKIYGPKGTATVTVEVTNDQRLKPGYGAMLGLFPVSAASGHAVAIHHLNSGMYHFFDPNFGVYEYDLTNLRRAIVFLFLQGYPGMNSLSLRDSKQYEDKDGNIRAEHVIYRRTMTSARAAA
jgi:Yersinia/Haemophilus virulence surface antigen